MKVDIEKTQSMLRKFKKGLHRDGILSTICKVYSYTVRYLIVYSRILFSIHITNKYKNHTAIKNIPLYVIFDHDGGGGSLAFREKHVKNLIEKDIEVLIIQYLKTYHCYFFKLMSKARTQSFVAHTFSAMQNFICELNVKYILCNNIVGYERPFDILDLILRLCKKNSSLYIFIHDFYSICPVYTLSRKDGVFCGVPSNLSQCKQCLLEHFGTIGDVPDIVIWREKWCEVLTAATRITAPDSSVKDIFMQIYPQAAQRICVKPHTPVRNLSPLPPLPHKAPVVIGIIGSIGLSKGARIVEDMVRIVMQHKLLCHIIVIGTIDTTIKAPCFLVTGRYKHDNLHLLVKKHNITVCLVPSVWPETFCYVAQEIEMLDRSLVCFNIGAQANRAQSYEKGHVVQKMDAQNCLDVIMKIENDRMHSCTQ